MCVDYTYDKNEKEYTFDVSGYYVIASKLKPVRAHNDDVIGFRLPDGRIARLVVALEVAEDDESSFEYVTSEQRMAALGFGCLDYATLKFERINNEDS